ncbi:MAG: heme exporter protein CcmB [Pseudomonadota bacterium]
MFRSELKSALNRGSSALPALQFSLLVLVLFVLGLPLGGQIAALLPVVLWVGLLLSVILYLNRALQDEHEDGFVAQLLLSSKPTWVLLVQQLIGRWIGFMLPYTAVVACLLFGMGCSAVEALGLLLGLWIGSLAVFALGSVGAALTVCVRQASLLLPVLLLPLYVPTLIFACHYSYAVLNHEGIMNLWFFLLCADTVFCCTISPYFMGAALKVSQW